MPTKITRIAFGMDANATNLIITANTTTVLSNSFVVSSNTFSVTSNTISAVAVSSNSLSVNAITSSVASNTITISSNTLTISSNTVTVSSNNMNLGSSSIASNGYTWLPNGLKMNWGTFNCNATSMVTFTNAFATGILSLSVTPRSSVLVAANTPYILASNTTTANIYSAATGATGQNAYFIAIGY